jgi:hypothetical protein
MICDVLREYVKKIPNLEPYEVRVEVYFNVVVRTSPYHEWIDCCPTSVDSLGRKVINHSGVHVLAHTPYTLDWFNEKRTARDEFGNLEKGDILDPISGRDLRINRKKKGQKTEYERELLDPSRLAETDEEIGALLDARVKFTDIWKFPDDEILLKIKRSAEMLKALFDTRISNSLQAKAPQPPSGFYQPESVSVEPKPIQQQSAVPAVSTVPSKPTFPTQTEDGKKIIWISSDVKECFSDRTVYHRDNAQIKLCKICPYEFECGENVKKLETGNFVLKRKP